MFLYKAFAEICKNENDIKNRYKEFMPAYTQTVRDAAKTLYQKYLGE